jgi:beta-galactosidase GanA
VKLADRRIWVGEQNRALLSGEVHYWRLDPADWPAVLERVRELGLDVLSTYVCWNFHELEPGRFDFVGDTNPRRDLLGFLDLAQREGFWVLLRPPGYAWWPDCASGKPTTRPIRGLTSTADRSVCQTRLGCFTSFCAAATYTSRI